MTSLVSVRLVCDVDEKDTLIAELYDRGTTGIVEREELGGVCTLEAFFEEAVEAEAVSREFEAHQPRVIVHRARDYVQEFQDQWRPVLLGRRIWLTPTWNARETPVGRVRVEFQAGMACGSGAHPCTQLCLEALDDTMVAGSRVADVGAGSGILLLAARALGASLVAGCDIEHDNIVIAAQALPEACLFTGSTASLPSAAFDIVVANISSEVVEELLAELRRIAAPAATLILSGFRESELPAGVEAADIRRRDGWACAVLRQR